MSNNGQFLKIFLQMPPSTKNTLATTLDVKELYHISKKRLKTN